MLSKVCAVLVSSAAALSPTQVKPKDCCTGDGCLSGLSLNFPDTVYPVTPRFDFNLTASLPESTSMTPTFSGNGSLGLPDHPLGIFKFETDGPACGEQKLYLEDGILAVITMDFPECPWTGDVTVNGRVDVWTTIPASASGLSTGFTMEVHVSPDAAETPSDLLCLRLGLNQMGDEGADPEQDVCELDFANMPEYPPKSTAEEDIEIPTVILDLDVDAKTRWDHIVRPRAEEIRAMVKYFSPLMNQTALTILLNTEVNKIMNRFPGDFKKEIQGVAKSTGLNVIEIFIYNIMYEVEGLCTSMVSQDADGHIYHSRNLDFGLFLGKDAETHNWKLTEMLRPLLMNVQVMKGGKNLYNMTHYAGYLGLLTGVKEGGFSISVDTRFDSNFDEYLVLWLLGKYDGEFLSFKTREIMETEENYTAALQALTHYKPLGPCYIIIGGAQSGEGAVVTLAGGRDTALQVRELKDELVNGSFFVLQTNYDWPNAPPAYDDRRYPALDCMHKLGADNTNWASLWGVMSSNPTKNALTTYTTLMSAETGHFEAYKQYCSPGPHCMPFLNNPRVAAIRASAKASTPVLI
jgi:acid ceramidase